MGNTYNNWKWIYLGRIKFKIMNDLISVIVPVYKVEQYLNDCINSLVNQSYKNLEIILVDDGSPDNCPIMCDNWAKKDKRIKVIHKKNGGLSSARNAGLDVANGDYFTFVDSDDWISLSMYEDMLKIFKNDDVDVVAGKINCYFEKTGIIKPFMESSDYYKITQDLIINKEKYQKLTLSRVLESAAWNKLYKASLFCDLRFKENRYYEDYLYIYNISKRIKNIYYIAKPYYYYRIRDNSICSSHTCSEDFEKNFQEVKTDILLNNNNNLIESVNKAEIDYYLSMCSYYVNDSIVFNQYRHLLQKVKINIFKLYFKSMIKYIICIMSKRLYKQLIHLKNNMKK